MQRRETLEVFWMSRESFDLSVLAKMAGRTRLLALGSLAVCSASLSNASLPSSNASLRSSNASQCQELPAWGYSVGIAMSVAGSVGINVGQNLQAAGIAHLPEESRGSPFVSKQWRTGMAVFIMFSILNFAALALAPSSVLTPIESIQFVTNICYNKFINGSEITARMLIGVTLALIGTVLSVVFGAQGDSCSSMAQLEGYWSQPLWLAWFGSSLSLAAASLAVHRSYTRRLKDGASPWKHELVLPITFTLSSALAGGAQMIVHSKVLSTLLGVLFGQGDLRVFTGSWLLYVTLFFVVVCGVIWVGRQTEGLGLYDPLVILPLLIGTYILFGGVAGGIFFNEFATLHVGRAGYGNWALYILGLGCVLEGLYLIATAGTQAEAVILKETAHVEERPAEPAESAKPNIARQRWLQAKQAATAGSKAFDLYKDHSPHLEHHSHLTTLMPVPNTIALTYHKVSKTASTKTMAAAVKKAQEAKATAKRPPDGSPPLKKMQSV